MTTIVLSSKAGYESALALSEALECKYENPYETENRHFLGYDKVIKYGFSPGIVCDKGTTIINKTKSTVVALDKIKTFKLFPDKSVPFTENIKEAAKWLKEGQVAARATATGHNSEGIVFCQTAEELLEADAKFFTKYVEHTNEFRVNVWRNKVVSVYDKVQTGDLFSFKLFKGVEEQPQLVEFVQDVYDKTKLDWYGLDILRDKDGKLTLLEINSAPILYPYTLKKLVSLIQEIE